MRLEELGTTIKKLRKEKGYSQEDLQKYSSITTRTISKIENGFIDEVGIKKVEMILDILGYEFSIREKGHPKTLEEWEDERR